MEDIQVVRHAPDTIVLFRNLTVSLRHYLGCLVMNMLNIFVTVLQAWSLFVSMGNFCTVYWSCFIKAAWSLFNKARKICY